MKLNLLPATVSRGRQTRTAWVMTVVIALLAVGASAALMIKSGNDVKTAKDEYTQALVPYNRAVQTSAQVESMMQLGEVQALVRNVALAHAMIDHNDDSPNLYRSLLPYIPPFYRITSMTATPISDSQANVQLQGTLGTYQQYADLMLALMRNPNAVSVSRSGYQADEAYVPNLVPADQVGRIRRPGDPVIPDDPLERLAYFESQSQPRGYSGVGNFGSGTDSVRQAMPGESLVTVQIVVNARLQTPNPRASLSSVGGVGSTSPGMGAGPTGGAPGMPGGMPGAGVAGGPVGR